MTNANTLADLVLGCESEQLHRSGAIQDFGAYLRVDRASGVISHASANLERFLGGPPEQLLGRPLADPLPQLVAPVSALGKASGTMQLLVSAVEGCGGWLDARLASDGPGVAIELQPSAGGGLAQVDIHRLQAELMGLPSSAEEMDIAHGRILDIVSAVSGFERVMVYRFHEDWSGEVVAESTTPAFGSYLGLRFPASDIPAIARDLYLINPARLISEAGAAPVPILSALGAAPDLTWSDLRSVSPVHMQYLAHMGVGASFSLPIKMAGRLWGMVACHHPTPRYLPLEHRQHCVALVHTYALTLTSFNATRRLQLIDSLETRIERALEAITADGDPRQGMDRNWHLLLDLVDADGIALAVEGGFLVSGQVPPAEAMTEIDHRFVNQGRDLFLATDRLPEGLADQPLDGVAGVLGIKTSSSRSGLVRLYWFRREEVQEVSWAGNPHKAVIDVGGSQVLSPRRSFEKWVEIRRGCSRPWSAEQKMVATKFRAMLLRWL